MITYCFTTEIISRLSVFLLLVAARQRIKTLKDGRIPTAFQHNPSTKILDNQ